MEMKINLSKAMNRINSNLLKEVAKNMLLNSAPGLLEICQLTINLASLTD